MKHFILIVIVLALFLSSCSTPPANNPDFQPLRHNTMIPSVVHMGWVDEGLLGITIKEGNLVKSEWLPYVEQDGDSVYIDVDEKGIVHKRTLFRNDIPVGYLAGEEMKWLSTFERLEGDSLDEDMLDVSSNYGLRMKDNKRVFNPEEVYRKSRVLTRPIHENGVVMLHTVYLRIPRNLLNKPSFIIAFSNLNLDKPQVTFYNTPEQTRSEAIHVTHQGFRPNDPVKRGYLSIWLGNGGGHQYAEAPVFSVFNTKTGESVFEGKATRALELNGTEKLKEVKNYTKTEVWHLDFSEFSETGEYLLFVEDVGISYPFEIADNVWEQSFSHVMKGFFTHRSGIAINDSANYNFSRPVCFLPDDIDLYRSDFSLTDAWIEYGGSQDGMFKGLVKNATDERVDNAWGGYMDAGDWDRRIQHLNATRQLIELYQMFPEKFADLKLSLLPEERNNHIPDILDEAAWNVDCYARMQTPEGGIPLGIESAAHPVSGETSWLESLDVFRFEPDPHSSMIFASVTAQLSVALANIDEELARYYQSSAIAAYQYGREYSSLSRFNEMTPSMVNRITNQGALAALEMFKLTGEAEYARDFLLWKPELSYPVNDESPATLILDIAYSLVTLNPGAIITAQMVLQAENYILTHADRMVEMIHNNSYNLTHRIPSVVVLNGYYSSGNNQELGRAYYLTGDKKYLEGALLSVMYTAGANPMNMTMTTGLGHNYPRRPLHIDSRNTGREAPHGITVYAQADHEYYKGDSITRAMGGQWATWATYWFAGRLNTPSGWDWPAHEAYVDYGNFPSMNEYTIHQTFGPIAYAYGFLYAAK